MTKDEIKAEISSLEAELKQMLANANFIHGAVQAFHKMLAKVEEREKTTASEVKSDVAADLTAEANKLEAPKT